MSFTRLLVVAIVSLLLFSPHIVKSQEAETLFTQYKTALVQIKSINIESGQKSSIGTGFFISDTGYLATNYHVISDVIQSPQQYRLEYVDHLDNTFDVLPVDIDVINDLAILKTDNTPDIYFALAEQAPKKGEDIFSLGNPHDLGMLVVPGTYNGMKSKSFYRRINFTGSLNPGMSGGPTVNEKGEVIGVNVSTAGNQLSFLVPVERLAALNNDAMLVDIDAPDPDFFDERILAQLTTNQAELFNEVLNIDWQTNAVGNISIPSELAEFMPCWGDSNQDKEKIQYVNTTTNCGLYDNIYLSSSFYTGSVNVNYNLIKSEKLSSLQLSTLYQSRLNNSSENRNAGQDDVSNFHCQESIVENQHAAVSKGVLCIRAYRQYEGLYDVKFKSVMLQEADETLIASYSLQGVTEKVADQFFEKFIESVEWN